MKILLNIMIFLATFVIKANAAETVDSIPQADIFYIISTEVMSAHDKDGKEIYNSMLCPQDTLAMYQEKEYVRQHYAGNMRFFAPYYEQFTMNALLIPREEGLKAYAHSKEDMFRKFGEYIATQNNGRPYILMGFSQGAMIALDLLKEMTDEQYANCKGVYMIGYRIAEQDTIGTRVKPATDAISGNAISFNSVTRPETRWELLTDGAITCINPLNWKTDDTPATLTFDGDTATVAVDKTIQQLVVKGLDEKKYTMPGSEPFYKVGCLHHWDLLFYTDAIKKNIIERLKNR